MIFHKDTSIASISTTLEYNTMMKLTNFEFVHDWSYLLVVVQYIEIRHLYIIVSNGNVTPIIIEEFRIIVEIDPSHKSNTRFFFINGRPRSTDLFVETRCILVLDDESMKQ